ncbi:hypothetical protein [Iningainema tapete]|uniref:Uncharacterized protein n=1 Tax=Iningainema tapete BLCC-T55 TaxID=2748662 RepID=A0A8J6XQ13_9CYAN|nr:hypothetical protein [Iningainema tapete]MBD2774307.1 hypothetical protein [Iningainema tapete BLCC-T55]
MTQLLPEEQALIVRKLPPQSAQLRYKYPNAIWNAADCWNDAPLPANYKPNRIEIYYADQALQPHIHFENDSVQYINLPADIGQSQVIQVWVDGKCSYVEVSGQIILNKLGGVQLPQPKVTASTIANSMHQTRN